MSLACQAVGGINLGQGVCDLPTPLPVASGATQAIAERAGLTKPQLHYYIRGKDELYEELLGSVLASIGLTIPLVITISLITGRSLVLGLDAAEMVLFRPPPMNE